MSRLPSDMNNSLDPEMEEDIDVELDTVNVGLKAIENVMIAENRRRMDSNQIMSQFIDDFLEKLQEQISGKVDKQFQTLQKRVQTIDDDLTNIENEIDSQINDVNSAIEKKEKYINKEIKQASDLYISVKEAKRIN